MPRYSRVSYHQKGTRTQRYGGLQAKLWYDKRLSHNSAERTVCDEGLSWWMRGTKCSCGHAQFRGSLAQEATLGQIGERFSAILADMQCCRGNRCCRPARSSRFCRKVQSYRSSENELEIQGWL